jgi:hypothetical protein
MKKVKTVVFGLGNIGLLQDINKKHEVYSHSKSVFISKKFDLIGAIDISKKNRELFLKKYNKPVFKNVHDFKNKNINFDLAIVAVPTKLHLKLFTKLSKLNFKYCLFEKPAGNNKSEFLKIKKIALKKNIKLFVNYIRLYQKKYYTLKKYLLDKNFATFYYNRGLMNNCSHLISFCIFNFGNIKRLKIIHRNKSFNGDIQPSFLLEFKKIKANFINVSKNNISFNELNIINKRNIIYSRDNFNSVFQRKISYKKKSNEKTLFLKDKKLQLTVLNEIYNYIFNKSKNSKKIFNRFSRNFLEVHRVLNSIKIKNRNF